MQHSTSYEVLIFLLFSSGQPVKLGFVGGSCTEGAGIPKFKRYLGWAPRLARSLQSIFNASRDNVQFYNGASGGVTSSYLATCIHDHLHNDSDLVFVELTVNDVAKRIDWNGEATDFTRRAPFEILIRRILSMPHHPAVIVFNGVRWSHQMEANQEGEYTNNAEADYSEFISYYGLPSISVKASVYHFMRLGVPNYIPTGGDERGESRNDTWFGGDGVHPNYYNGHRAYYDMAIHLIIKAAKGLKRRPLSELDVKYASEPLPSPVIPGNFETGVPSCYFSTNFQQLVVEEVDFPWVNSDPEQRWVKWGYAAKKPGAKLTIKLNIRPALRDEDVSKALNEAALNQSSMVGPSVNFAILYVKSWRGYGKASYECRGGCECRSDVVDGDNRGVKVTLVMAHDFPVRLKLEKEGEGARASSEDCLVTWTVLEESASPKDSPDGVNNFKISGAVLSLSRIELADFNHAGLLVRHSTEFTENNLWTSTFNESIGNGNSL